MHSFIVTFKEFIEYSVVLLLLARIYKDRTYSMVTAAIVTVVAGFLITLFNHPLTTSLEQFYTKSTVYSFVLILYLSMVSGNRTSAPLICVISALLFPSAQLAAVMTRNAELQGWTVYLYTLLGASAALFCFIVVRRSLERFDLARFFGKDGIMIFIAAFCFLFGGLDEFDSTSVITSLQKGLNDLVGHPRFAMAITALLLFIPPIYVFIRLLFEPEPVIDTIEIKAEKRKMLAIYISKLIRKGIPVLIALFVLIVMLHAANLAMNPLFDPEPIPVIIEGDRISIPLSDSRGAIDDGRIRKYSFRDGGSVYRLLVLMRPDGNMVATLDACEICPPTGYVQRGEHVICKYCGTPIPIQSLGEPGGCNPIPLDTQRDGDALIISRNHVIEMHNKWLGDASSHSGH
jgi:uncharacterized membrane protein